jgi:hypothetical protein
MTTTNAAGSFRQKMLTLRLLSVALAGGLLIFLGVQFVTTRCGSASSSATIMTTMSAAAWLAGLIAGFLLYQTQLNYRTLNALVANLSDDAALHAIYPRVQIACLIRWALLEGPALFAAVVLFLNGMNIRGQPILVVDLVVVLLSVALILLTVPSQQTMQEIVRQARRAGPSRPRG